jgi:predicted metal-dependent HD superfamily phosphohydrolase
MDTEKAGWQNPERSRRTPDNLRTIWDKLAGKYCNDNELTNRFYEEIERKYTSNRRHYHNLHHIAALLRFCEQYAGELNDHDVVAFAVFYHDIIYNPLRKDNEPRSAQLAVKRLQALHVPATAIEQVKLYIEATQTHDVTVAVTHIGDLQLFLDFDMSILAADWNTYEAYTRQVRKEYRIYPDKLYYPGRKQFLQHCLQTAHIFQTPVFRESYEGIARKNMARELESIDNRQN